MDIILNLKKEYEKDIEIHLGPWNIRNISRSFFHITGQYPIEYFLAGPAFSENEIDDVYSGDCTRPRIRRYSGALLSAMPRGHADGLLYLFCPPGSSLAGDPAVYDHWMRVTSRGCEKGGGLPLEINFLGIGGHRHYLNPASPEDCGEVGNW